MKRIIESFALCLAMSACFHAAAMPLGVRTLLHAHAVARQSVEGEPLPQPWMVTFEVNGEAVEFVTAEDGKTRTATVVEGTAAEDVKVAVGGVDVTKGFKIEVAGTMATVALVNPFEMPREEAGSESDANSAWEDNGDGTVTLNVEVVPGLYYAAASSATLEALNCPGAQDPAKAGDALVAPKQSGSQGFYKVWVSDSPIEAE